MAAVVTRLRGLISDPAGASATFTDDELQTFLDNNATDVFYEPLTAQPTIAPGGVTAYLTWQAAAGNWETGAETLDGSYNVLTATVTDLQRGRWTFATTQNAVLVRGACFDVHLAAADALEAWAVKLKLAYDFSADGGDFKRSQQIKALQDLAITMRSNAGGGGGVLQATMYRGDVVS